MFSKLSNHTASTVMLSGSPDQSTTAAKSSLRAKRSRSAPEVCLPAGSYAYTPTTFACSVALVVKGSKWTYSATPATRMRIPKAPYARSARYSVLTGSPAPTATFAVYRALRWGPLRSHRFAVSAAFFCFGTVAGSLVPRMPAFKESLHLTDGQVGLAFVVYAAGAVAGAVLARPILAGGARIWVRVLTVVMLAALIAPALAPGFAVFAATFLVLGILGGMIDVLENSQAAEIERDAGRPMINGFHGYWSLGFVAGGVVAAAAAALGLGPLPHFAVVAALSGVVSMIGVALAVALPEPVTAIAGFTLVGAGCAVMVPLAFSAGANLGRTGTALIVVTAAGYGGSIIGPWLIGSAADRFGLRIALVVALVAAGAVLSTAFGLRSRAPG